MRIERLSPEAWTPPYVCPTRARPVPGVRSWEAMRVMSTVRDVAPTWTGALIVAPAWTGPVSE